MREQNLVCFATRQFAKEPWSLDNYVKRLDDLQQMFEVVMAGT